MCSDTINFQIFDYGFFFGLSGLPVYFIYCMFVLFLLYNDLASSQQFSECWEFAEIAIFNFYDCQQISTYSEFAQVTI